MSKTILEIAINFKKVWLGDLPDKVKKDCEKDFNELCEYLCREQRELCLEGYNASFTEDQEAENIKYAPTPKWRSE